MPQTIVEKIAQTHLAEGPKRPLRTGDFVSIRPHRVMTHDNTSAVMSKFKGIGAKKIHNPAQLVFALDHDIQNRDEANLKKYRSIEAFAKEHGVEFYPAGSGIGHQIMVERGYVIPGSFVVASDSHSNMYGALGAIGTPIVRTDAAAVWATGEFWWQIPRSIQVVLEGKLPAGATGKDIIITLCGLYNHDEVLNSAVEFSGPGVASLSMDARFSISNMSTEWGPLVGWFPVDEVTIRYLRGVHQRLKASGVDPERYTGEVTPLLQRYAGLHLVALGCRDARQAARDLGIRLGAELGIRELGRDVPQVGGGTKPAQFHIVGLPAGTFPEAKLFLIEQATPDVLWQQFVLRPSSLEFSGSIHNENLFFAPSSCAGAQQECKQRDRCRRKD
jgi:homoaconitase